jgi:hypothetical protein
MGLQYGCMIGCDATRVTPKPDVDTTLQIDRGVLK